MRKRVICIITLSLMAASCFIFAGESKNGPAQPPAVCYEKAPRQEGVTPPVLEKRTDPPLQKLRHRDRKGYACVKASIDEHGVVVDVTAIASSSPGFEAMAIDTVKKWRYKPAQ